MDAKTLSYAVRNLRFERKKGNIYEISFTKGRMTRIGMTQKGNASRCKDVVTSIK